MGVGIRIFGDEKGLQIFFASKGMIMQIEAQISPQLLRKSKLKDIDLTSSRKSRGNCTRETWSLQTYLSQ